MRKFIWIVFVMIFVSLFLFGCLDRPTPTDLFLKVSPKGSSGYTLTFALHDQNDNFFRKDGTAKLQIFDSEKMIYETELEVIESDFKDGPENFIAYSEDLPITANELKELTNDATVDITLTFITDDKTFTKTTDCRIF